MSIIVPAGVKEVKWSPMNKKGSMTKTASTDTGEQEEPQDDKDILFEAAKKVMADRQANEASEEEEASGGIMAEDGDPVDSVDAVEDGDDGDSVEVEMDGIEEEPCAEEPCDDDDDEVEISVSDPATTIQEAVSELAEKAEAAEAAAEVVEEAVETISAVIEEVKGKMGVDEGEGVDVGEDSFGDDNDEAVIEVVDTVEGIPGEPMQEEESDMIVEGDEEEQDIFASISTDNMVKIAKLSPENKKKLDSYWKSFYGEASDWVDLLTKD